MFHRHGVGHLSRIALISCFGLAWVAGAQGQVQSTIQDVTSLKGMGINVLVGTGLVTGLNGTGDGDQYAPTMRALAEMMKNLGAPVESGEELRDTNNVAIVNLEVVIPPSGAREGDRLDVQVTSIGAASSLEGGRLLVSPMIFHDLKIPTIFATCRGALEIPDASIPTTARIRDGAAIEEDVIPSFMIRGADLRATFAHPWIEPVNNYITLVIDDAHAGFGLAAEIANTIETELGLVADVDQVAMAMDSRNIVVMVPPSQDPAQWISAVEDLRLLMPEGEARITIDRKSGTIVVSGNVTIAPVIVSQKGMTIKVLNPDVPPDPLDPRLEDHQFVPVDPGPERRANVEDLLVALNRLQVPIDDRIAILSEMERLGRLNARIMYAE